MVAAIMWHLSLHGKRRDFLTSVLLAALLFRAYVPVGFMPAPGTPFLLQICATGLMASMPAHHADHQHSRGHSHFENCPFGSAPGAGPISQVISFSPPEVIPSTVFVPAARIPLRAQISRAHQPRGPPSLA